MVWINFVEEADPLGIVKYLPITNINYEDIQAQFRVSRDRLINGFRGLPITHGMSDGLLKGFSVPYESLPILLNTHNIVTLAVVLYRLEVGR